MLIWEYNIDATRRTSECINVYLEKKITDSRIFNKITRETLITLLVFYEKIQCFIKSQWNSSSC